MERFEQPPPYDLYGYMYPLASVVMKKKIRTDDTALHTFVLKIEINRIQVNKRFMNALSCI